MATTLACKRLEGKVAIITGGASGIGEATVRLFVENGASVVIADIQDEIGSKLADELGGDVAVFQHCDVRLERDVEAAVALALTRWGALDIMFNNVGVLGRTLTEDVRNADMDEFDWVMSVNVRGAVLGIKHASRSMVERGVKGVILCSGSVAGVLGGLSSVMYTVSKHALVGLVRAASSDLGKFGIRVNCISPSGLATPLLVKYMQSTFADPTITKEQTEAFIYSKANLTGHVLTAADVARAALFLASDDGAFVSGLNLLVDGGLTASNHAFDS